MELGRQKQLYDLWGYVNMPEHVHVVLLPAESVGVSRILQTIKQSVSRRAVAARASRSSDSQGSSHRVERRRFWLPGGGYDRNLRSVADVHEKIDYIHANPVRRGLTGRPEDWPWSSYRAWETGKDEPIAIDRESLPPLMK